MTTKTLKAPQFGINKTTEQSPKTKRAILRATPAIRKRAKQIRRDHFAQRNMMAETIRENLRTRIDKIKGDRKKRGLVRSLNRLLKQSDRALITSQAQHQAKRKADLMVAETARNTPKVGYDPYAESRGPSSLAMQMSDEEVGFFLEEKDVPDEDGAITPLAQTLTFATMGISPTAKGPNAKDGDFAIW